jgi:hypothetical protein
VTPDERAESIRRRMAELRRELAIDVRDVGRSARAMTNPSFYIRRFPWATMAIAAAAGFLLIPRKKQVIYPDPDTLAELVRKKQVKLDTSQAAKGSKGLLETVAVMGLSWAARTGLNYVTQQLTTAAAKKANEPKPQPVSPLEQTGQSKR